MCAHVSITVKKCILQLIHVNMRKLELLSFLIVFNLKWIKIRNLNFLKRNVRSLKVIGRAASHVTVVVEFFPFLFLSSRDIFFP